jgi:hypothetical protein
VGSRRRAASYTVRYLRVGGHPDHAGVKDKIKVREFWIEIVNCSRVYILSSQVEKLAFPSRIHDLKNSHFWRHKDKQVNAELQYRNNVTA